MGTATRLRPVRLHCAKKKRSFDFHSTMSRKRRAVVGRDPGSVAAAVADAAGARSTANRSPARRSVEVSADGSWDDDDARILSHGLVTP